MLHKGLPLLLPHACCYLTRVTGGTPDKPTRNVNICLYNVAEAVQMLTPHMEPSLFARLVCTEKTPYQLRLFGHLPLYTTRLVREAHFTFPERTQVQTPGDVAAVLRAYFEDRDREEFIVCLLDTANTLVGLSRGSWPRPESLWAYRCGII